MEHVELTESACKNTHAIVEKLVLEEKTGRRILDIPCGEGAFTKRLQERNIDIVSADCVHTIKLPDTRFETANMNDTLPFEEGYFDGIVCIDGIEHIEKQFDFVRECNRILKKDGYLIISTPNISALRSRFRWLITGFHGKCKTPLNEKCPTPADHINMISFPELRYILETNGFTVKKITTNRVKLVSWLYLLFVPFSFMNTLYWFKKEAKNETLKEIYKQIFPQLFSIPVLFGETLIVKAVKR